MENNYFVFKLNVQPNTLNLFKKPDEFNFLIEKMIPHILDATVGLHEIRKMSDTHPNWHKINPEKGDEKEFNKQFLNLEKETLKLQSFYEDIFAMFKDEGRINYSSSFLQLNDKCIRLRTDLEKEYPSIKNAYTKITDETIDTMLDFEIEKKIGTGITHLRKFKKITVYVEENIDQLINPLNLTSYYNSSLENIFVESDSESKALSYITALEKKINNDPITSEEIGKININPVYDSISFNDEEYTEISFVIVYPNGNPPLDRHNILKNSEAKELHQTLIGSDGQPLKTKAIETVVNEQASKGYLKDLVAKTKKKSTCITKRIKRVTNLHIH